MTSPISDTLAKLRYQFADQLPARMAAILAHFQRLDPSSWQPTEAQALHHLVHGLTGSAGTFGMHSVSDVARMVETRLAPLLTSGAAPTAAQWRKIGADLNRLDQLARIRLDSAAPSLKPPTASLRQDRSPLIYLVEDESDQAAHLSQALQDDGYRVRVFTSTNAFRSAYAASDTERPDAVLMDMIFPEGDDAGAALIAELGISKDAAIPVVIISVRDDLAGRLAAFRAGACRYMVKPVESGQLIDLLDVLTGRQPDEAYRVLMVDDDPLLLEAQAVMLRAAGMEVQTLSQPLRIMEALHNFIPDVAVLDVYMPGATGPELAAVLRERDAQLHLPILFLSAETDMTQQLRALNLGGDDFLTKPVQPDHLVAAVTARARRARQNHTIRQRLETTLYEREREHLALNQHAIVSIADQTGKITYINDKFCEISGYTLDELLGQNHRIIKSGEHPPEFYQGLWHTIASGNIWQGEICNRRKDGSLYWVASTITPFLDTDGIPYQYVSIRTDISHMKIAEAALRASESRLNFILTASPVVIYTCKAEPGFPPTYVSPNIQELFGFHPAQCLQNPNFWVSGIHPEDASRVLAGFEGILDREELHHEYRFRMPDGSYRWIHDSLRVVRSAESIPLEIVGYWADIDDRVRAEQAAQAHKERLRRGQLFANIGTWDWNIQTGELFWTERIAPLFGHPVGELETSYDNFLAAIHPDDRQAVIAAVKACIERDAPYEIEHRVVWPDGTVRWLFERGAVVRDANDNPLQMLGVVQDIDDRKRAEMALAEREKQLREAQTMAHIGNWTADIASNNLTWSDEIYRIFGHEPGSFTPSIEAFKAAIHPDDRELERNSEELAAKTGRHDVVHRIVRPDGSVRYVHELAQAESDASAKLLRLSGTVQDITERVEVEQAMIVARDEAERANAAKSEFLSSMSHELRTPMNAILGFGQLLEFDKTLTDEQKDSVQEILKGGHHLLELINEVLDLAKIESGHIDLSLEPVLVCPIVDECLSLVSTLAAKRDIRLSHKGLEGAAVRADRTRFKQVLLNLLSNAIKYNREGGSVHLEVQLHTPNRLRLLVTDTGLGISAAGLTELFLPFNRLDAASSDIEGTGIGLTITRRLIEMMGGTVDVESTVGVGSTFWIELPQESTLASIDEHAHITATNGDTPAQHNDTDQHTLLYIEDNPANLRLMAQILGRHKHIRLLTAHTAELGIELALARHPDLILLDINLPDMDGYQMQEVLKTHENLKSTPVIAVSANALPRDIERGKAAGFNAYLTKPIDIVEFYGVLDRCLPNHKKDR